MPGAVTGTLRCQIWAGTALLWIHFPIFFTPIPPGCSSWELAWREGSWEGAGIKEREMERGMAGAPGPRPAAPGPVPRWKRRVAQEQREFPAHPRIWELLASPGGTGQGLKRAQGARAAKNPPSPWDQSPSRRENWGNWLPAVPPTRNTEKWRLKNNSCDYSEWDFGSLTSPFPAAGSGSLESLQQEPKANKTHPPAWDCDSQAPQEAEPSRYLIKHQLKRTGAQSQGWGKTGLS